MEMVNYLRALALPTESIWRALITTFLILFTLQSHGADDSLDIKLTQFRVETQNGKEVLLSASEVKPGDLIEYRAIYTNKKNQPISKVITTLPLPQGLVYVPRSGFPTNPKMLASTGNGSYAAEPLLRKHPENGDTTPVPYEQYRSLRWQFDALGAGKSLEIRARARVAGTAELTQTSANNGTHASVEAGSAPSVTPSRL